MRFFRPIRHDVRGAAMAEFALILPLIVFVTMGVVQLSMYVFALQQLDELARFGARTIAVSNFDDETAGTATGCSSLTGTAPDGSTSAEQQVCNRRSSLFGELSVSITDGDGAALAETGTLVTATISVARSDVIIFDVFGASSGNYTRSATRRME